MPNLSEFKTQITRVQDINKITKAMELVSTSKLKKLGKKVVDMQEYISEVYKMFVRIIDNSDNSKYLFNKKKEYKNPVWIVIGSNLGLCGGYNSNIIKLAKKNISKSDNVITVGTKMTNFFKGNNYNVFEQILNVDENFSIKSLTQLTSDLISKYNNEEIDAIKILYTKFINNATFQETVLDLIPIIRKENEIKDQKSEKEILFEPDASTILEMNMGFYVNTIIYGSIMESQLSEHASRRIAMEAASKNGKELYEEYKSLYNKKRQEGITQEIIEIVAGSL
ncbi:ATP synthase F1 subunit gamma [Spiroplasma endosymbiont of Crioceris asparagi]|uniref:ATP synthase F1 subunit gamma n=1 Tax=Spiroplasma endosymbiont of Crioceris asparagi TaxID=3066286 RepID=UPI0030CE90D5